MGQAEIAVVVDPTDEQLLPFGYAPGNYMMKCPECRSLSHDVDKRARRCRQCAVSAFRARTAEPPRAFEDLATSVHDQMLAALRGIDAAMTDAGFGSPDDGLTRARLGDIPCDAWLAVRSAIAKAEGPTHSGEAG